MSASRWRPSDLRCSNTSSSATRALVIPQKSDRVWGFAIAKVKVKVKVKETITSAKR